MNISLLHPLEKGGQTLLIFLLISAVLASGCAATPTEPDHEESSNADQVMQTVGHVLRSHTGGLAIRPVSSTYRLLFLLSNTTADTVRPDWIFETREPLPAITYGPGMDLAAWEQQLDRLTGRPTSRGTLEYLVDGDEYFKRMIEAVHQAQESIHVRTYIFDNDDVAMQMASLFKERASDQLDVEILLDGLGTIVATSEQSESLPRGYTAPVSVRKFLEDESTINVRQVTNPWFTGDHIKTTIIDHEIAFLGGMNIGREYLYDWHDMMVELHGPIVDELRNSFHSAWSHAGPLGDLGYVWQKLQPRKSNPDKNGYPMRLLYTRPHSSEIYMAQLEAIRRANQRIYIQNAYFTDDTVMYELIQARRRGVDVRVIIPREIDYGLLERTMIVSANQLIENGIRVFMYPGMSHVKAAVFDGWATFGTANYDRLSFRVNKEINIATSHPPAVEGLIEQIFRPDFAASIELTEPTPNKWSDRIVEIAGDFIF